jgi:hypothetical protein
MASDFDPLDSIDQGARDWYPAALIPGTFCLKLCCSDVFRPASNSPSGRQNTQNLSEGLTWQAP